MSVNALKPDEIQEALLGCISALQDENWHIRETATETLIKIGKPAIPHLIETLGNPHDDVRREAAEILHEIGWQPRCQDDLILYAFASQQWDILVAMGNIAVPAFDAALHDDNFYVRTSAALALGAIGGAHGLRLLERAIRDENTYVRSAAVRSLSEFGEDALHALIYGLQDQEKGVRLEASTALIKIGAKAVPGIIQVLRECDWFTRREVAQALIKIGTPAIPAVANLLRDPSIAPDAAQILRALNVDPATYGYHDDAGNSAEV